jgi:hypothetical protein
VIERVTAAMRALMTRRRARRTLNDARALSAAPDRPGAIAIVESLSERFAPLDVRD